MADDSKKPLEASTSSVQAGEAPAKRAPTLYVIIFFKVAKGAFFLAAAIALYCLSDDNLPSDLRRFLHLLRIHPDTAFWSELADKVGRYTESNLLRAAAGVFIYSLFAWVEGIGMMFRVSWAGWLAIGESAFFIPLEALSLVHKVTWPVSIVLVINIVIVWYLIQNRHRLFRHHHH